MALRNGSRFAVSMQDVFADGCALMPDSIAEAMDYDEKTKRRTPAADKLTGKPVWQCLVADNDRELAGRRRETVVKIISDRKPVPPTGAPYEAVEFEGITVTPYVTDKGRMAYSLRATAIKGARPAGKDVGNG
jgi:hypothetical protein